MFAVFQASGAGGSTGGGSTGGGSTGGGSTGGGSTGGGSSGGGSSGGGTTAPVAVRATLAATVGSTGKLKLLSKGKAVSLLKAGRYRITVTDKTPARSFVVQQNKKAAILVSSVPFVGTRSVIVTLRVGQWTFYTSAGAKSKSSFSVVA
jgi:hypothetical protein